MAVHEYAKKLATDWFTVDFIKKAIGNGSLTMETGLTIMKPNHREFFLREVKAQMQQNPSG